MPGRVAARMYSRLMPSIRPVVLSGGSGTRLWPVSTSELPKQFAPLLSGATLFERTLQRLDGAPGVEAPIVVTGAGHADLAIVAAERTGVAIGLMIVEPEGRNTAPAALAAALAAPQGEVLVILPSDHLIADHEQFTAAVGRAAGVASKGRIVTFGVPPTSPETGYGYIEMGAELDGAFAVERFKEKPPQAEAEELAGDGRHLWNSGIFVVPAELLIEIAAELCPDLLEGVRQAMKAPDDRVIELAPSFADVEKISIDHAIMERTSAAVVIQLDVGWDDIGSFDALWRISDRDEQGNVISGDVLALDLTGSLIRASSRRVAVSGLEDVVVIETPEAVLVIPRSSSQLVRDLAAGQGPD